MKKQREYPLNSDQNQNKENISDPQFDLSNFADPGKGITPSEVREHLKELSESFEETNVLQVEPFPTGVFPLALQNVVKAATEHLQYPTDFIGASILFAVSLAIGNTHKIEVKSEWQENAVLYLCIVGKAGTNKSHPLSFAIQPILDYDKESFSKYEREKAEYEKWLSLPKKERQQQNIDEPQRPFWKKFIVSDYTPEALAQVHKINQRGIGVYVDELAGWIKNFNRYHKGGDQEFWLSNWSGKPVIIDRKTVEPIFISQPFIPVIGTIQNAILDEIAKDSRTHNGFIDRILFVIPDNLKKPYWSDSEISRNIIDIYRQTISKLLNLQLETGPHDEPSPAVLSLAPEAKQLLSHWQKQNTDLCNETENEMLTSIYSKLEIYAVRLSLILQMMHWACQESGKAFIEKRAVEGAIKLVEYFRKTAVKVHTLVTDYSPLDKLPKDKRKLYEALPELFTTEIGVQIAESLGIPERTFKRFIADRDLFDRISQGNYAKRF